MPLPSAQQAKWQPKTQAEKPQSFAKAARLCARQGGQATKAKAASLTLAELEAAASALLAVLLAFLHARIARQEAILTEPGAQLGVKPRDGARKAHADGASLAADSATLD